MTREEAVKGLREEIALLEAKIDRHSSLVSKLEQEWAEWENSIKFLKDKIKEITGGRR